MYIINTVRTMKQIHPTDVLLIKTGKFFYAYGKDAYIISYLLDYQLKRVENINSTGFPETAIKKVNAILEEKYINYIMLNRGNNYEVLHEEDFKGNNRYSEVYSSAHIYQTKKSKIDNLTEYLLSNIDDEFVMKQLQRMEEIMHEKR